MAISPFKTFSAGEVLTASDLNSSFTQITNNGEDLGWPATKAKDLNGQELIMDADGDTSFTADTDDQIDVKIAGADDFQWLPNIYRAIAGSVFETDTINETTSDAGVTVDGVLNKDGGVTTTADINIGGGLNFSGSNPVILGNDTNGVLDISASTSNILGAVLKLHGDTQTNAGDAQIIVDGVGKLRWDESAGIFIITEDLTTGGLTASPTAGEGGAFIDAIGVIRTSRDSTSNVGHHIILNPNGEVGSIKSSGTATSFNTSSDRRLKSKFRDISAEDAWKRFDKILACSGAFEFLADLEKEVWGFDAQALLEANIDMATAGDGGSDLVIGDVYDTKKHPTILGDKEHDDQYKIVEHEAETGLIPILDKASKETGDFFEGVIKPAWKEKVLVKKAYIEKDAVLEKAWVEDLIVSPSGVDQSKELACMMVVINDLREKFKSLVKG